MANIVSVPVLRVTRTGANKLRFTQNGVAVPSYRNKELTQAYPTAGAPLDANLTLSPLYLPSGEYTVQILDKSDSVLTDFPLSYLRTDGVVIGQGDLDRAVSDTSTGLGARIQTLQNELDKQQAASIVVSQQLPQSISLPYRNIGEVGGDWTSVAVFRVNKFREIQNTRMEATFSFTSPTANAVLQIRSAGVNIDADPADTDNSFNLAVNQISSYYMDVVSKDIPTGTNVLSDITRVRLTTAVFDALSTQPVVGQIVRQADITIAGVTRPGPTGEVVSIDDTTVDGVGYKDIHILRTGDLNVAGPGVLFLATAANAVTEWNGASGLITRTSPDFLGFIQTITGKQVFDITQPLMFEDAPDAAYFSGIRGFHQFSANTPQSVHFSESPIPASVFSGVPQSESDAYVQLQIRLLLAGSTPTADTVLHNATLHFQREVEALVGDTS